jgi:hypothetical protein
MDIVKTVKIQEIRNFNILYKATQPSKFMIRYLQEFPGWKLSYRILIKNAEKKEDQKLILQAWAIVDNVLDENWDGINLTLVAGMPVSFIYDSYSPKWIVRPEIKRKKEITVNVATLQSSRADLALGGAPPMMAKEKASFEMRAPCAPPGAAPRPSMARKMKAMAKPMNMMDMDDEATDGLFEGAA